MRFSASINRTQEAPLEAPDLQLLNVKRPHPYVALMAYERRNAISSVPNPGSMERANST
jgi:hypothetical protein